MPKSITTSFNLSQFSVVGYSRLARLFKCVFREPGFFHHLSPPSLTYTLSFFGIKKVARRVIIFTFYRGGRRKGKVKGKVLLSKNCDILFRM